MANAVSTQRLDTRLTNYVDITTNQNIGGSKTFNNGIVVCRDTGNGALKILPSIDSTSDSSIGFFRYYDMRIINPGDMWIMGQNTWSAGGGNFAIGNHATGSVLQLGSNGDVTVLNNIYKNNGEKYITNSNLNTTFNTLLPTLVTTGSTLFINSNTLNTTLNNINIQH